MKYVTVYEDSDGFIPKKRSMMSGTNILNVELPGVNHLEMNSHHLMRQTLFGILRDGMYGDSFNYNR